MPGFTPARPNPDLIFQDLTYLFSLNVFVSGRAGKPVNFTKTIGYGITEVCISCFQCGYHQLSDLPHGRRYQKANGKVKKSNDFNRGHVAIACAFGNILQIFCCNSPVLYRLPCGDLYVFIPDKTIVDQMMSIASP